MEISIGEDPTEEVRVDKCNSDDLVIKILR